MIRITGVLFACCLFLAAGSCVVDAAPADASLGLGAHYNVLSGDADYPGFDSNYFSYVLSLRQRLRPNLSVELSLDYYPGAGEIDRAVRPFAALIWGGLINFGTGVTRSYVKYDTGESEWSDVSYQLQGGISMPLSRGVDFNVDAFYFLKDFGEIKDMDFKSLTFAARLFFRF